jgi:hypothetical protein
MVKHLIRFLSSLLIAGALFALYLTQSGAPVCVHIAEGIALFIAFVIPAQFISSLEDLGRRWFTLLGIIICGLLVREWPLSLAVAKYDFNMAGLIIPSVGVAMLLLLHILIISSLLRLSSMPS